MTENTLRLSCYSKLEGWITVYSRFDRYYAQIVLPKCHCYRKILGYIRLYFPLFKKNSFHLNFKGNGGRLFHQLQEKSGFIPASLFLLMAT